MRAGLCTGSLSIAMDTGSKALYGPRYLVDGKLTIKCEISKVDRPIRVAYA